MNSALNSYLDLTDSLLRLCQATCEEEFTEILDAFLPIVQRVNDFGFFPLDLDCSYIDSIRESDSKWDNRRNELCSRLYVSLATLMYRFEGSNIHSRAYYDYILELARTSLPYEVTNEWGKSYVLDKHFSEERFFFAINRDTRFLLGSEEEYEAYRCSLREKVSPSRPVEKEIPHKLIKELQVCYSSYYHEYCRSIEELYPEIKTLFSGYNKHLRIYLCSSDTSKANPSIDYLLIYYYRSTISQVSVYPYYVDLAYRFCNIEDTEEKIIRASMSLYKEGNTIYNIVDRSFVFFEANSLFVQHSSKQKLLEYVCYFLRGNRKRVEVLGNEYLQCDDYKVVLCDADITLDQIVAKFETIDNPYFYFVSYPAKPILEFLKEKKVKWECVQTLGNDMINNNNSNMVHWFIRDSISELRDVQVDDGGNILIDKLSKCNSGKLFWHEYEIIGAEALQYLFRDDFHEYLSKTQSSTADSALRRDLVISNTFKDPSSFWGRIYSQYRANVIIVDFKNYDDCIDSDCICSVTKYFSANFGYFAIILSRNGISESGLKEQIRLCREGKEVLCLSDGDLIEMIRLKQSNNNPCRVLERLHFALLQSM